MNKIKFRMLREFPELKKFKMKKNKLIIGLFVLLFVVSAMSVEGALTDGLTAYWSFDETSGTMIHDNTTGDIHNATGYNNPLIVSGVLGNARKFVVSSSQYYRVNNSADFNVGTGNFSIMGWLNKSNDILTGCRLISKQKTSANYIGWTLLFDEDSGKLGKLGLRAYSGSAYNYEAYSVTNFSGAGWKHFAITIDTTNKRYIVYVNGLVETNSTYTTVSDITGTDILTIGSNSDGTGSFCNVTMDEISFYKGRVLLPSEVNQSYNGGVGLAYPFTPSSPASVNGISFVSQNPVNVTAFSLFSQNVNLTFNYTNESTKLSNISLNYSLSGSQSCLIFVNGSCKYLNNTLMSVSSSLNVSSLNYTVASYYLGENQIYPYTAIVNSTFLDRLHSNYTMTGNNDFLAFKLLNVSNVTRSNILEIDLLSTVSSKIYLCNSSISLLGALDPLTSLNCQEVGSINSNSFNHTHGLYSGHNLVPFSILNGKVGGSGISVTGTMWILSRGNNLGVVNVGYVPNGSLATSVYSSGNGGNTWTDRSATYTIDFHLHQYGGSETLKYYAYGKFNLTLNVSLNVSELIDVPPLNPSPAIINSPFNTVQGSRYLLINYSNATANTIGSSIAYYNLTLLNENGSINRTIVANNSLNNSYVYDLYSQNLSLGQYFVRVTAFDSLGASAYDDEWFNLTRNALLNVTAFDISTNASISNLSINVTDLSTGLMQSLNGSAIGVDIVKGGNYSIYFDVQNYAYYTTTYIANNSPFQYLNQSLYKTNSVTINIYDETSLTLLTNVSAGGVINITFISDAGSFTYNTSTGSLFVSNITEGYYEVKFNTPLYSQRSYYLTVTNRSTQTLNAYLSQSTISLLLTYVNKETGELIEGVGVNVYKIINGSWTAVATGFTDITGRLQVSVATNTNYRFSSTLTGYDDKTFNLNPVIFTSYTIQLTKQQSSATQLDFSNINVYITNTTFKNNGSNSFSWQISAPSGNLESYGYSLYTQCKNISAFSGINAYGGINAITFNLSCATVNDYVTLNYNYTLVDGEVRTFTYTYGITGNATSTSFLGNRDQKYGMGLFERILLVVLITIVFAGLVTKFSNIIAGLVAGLFIMSYLSYIGFVEWWIIAPTLLAGFVLISSWSTSR